MSKHKREIMSQEKISHLHALLDTLDVVLVGESFRPAWQGQAMSVPDGVTHFFKRFGVTADQVKEEGYRPLFLAYGNSRSGEESMSFGLLEKEGALFEVHGTECSVWDFNGQWEPEATSVNALRHRLDKGYLGCNEGNDDFHQELGEYLDKLEPSLAAPEVSSKRSPRAPH